MRAIKTEPGTLERELLRLLACRFLGTASEEEILPLLAEPLCWSRWLEISQEEGLSSLVGLELERLCHRSHLDLPIQPFRQALRETFARNGALLAELFGLRAELRRRGLQAILLKGGSLLHTAYAGRIGLRPVSDIDLLIRAPELPAFAALLHERGFRSVTSHYFLKHGLAVDLHTDLIGQARIQLRASAWGFDLENLWREALPLDPAHPFILRLSWSSQMLHLAVHTLKHGFSRLIWLIDVALVARERGQDWDELVQQARRTGSLRALGYALASLEHVFRVDVPAQLKRQLKSFNPIERVFVHRVTRRKTPFDAFGELMVVFSIRSRVERAKYVFELLFPSGEVLAETFPSTPAYLRYGHRLIQLAKAAAEQGFRWSFQGLRPSRRARQDVVKSEGNTWSWPRRAAEARPPEDGDVAGPDRPRHRTPASAPLAR